MLATVSNIEQTLNEEGYVLLPKIEDAVIEQLKEVYDHLIATEMQPNEMLWSITFQNKALVSYVSKTIVELVFPHIEKHIKNICPITGTFMAKSAKTYAVQAHQDWTFVNDEPSKSSYTCWLPLVNTHEENGMMGFYPKSHLQFLHPRASPTPHIGQNFPQSEDIYKHIKYVPQQAGQAAVFNHRTIHASLPNITDQDRPAIGLSFRPLDAQLIHVSLKPGNQSPKKVCKYAIDEKFFNRFSNDDILRYHDAGKLLDGYEIIGEQDFDWENY